MTRTARLILALTLLSLLILAAMAAAPAAASCQSCISIAVAAADDPATVVQRFIDARNRFDVEGTLAVVTDDFRLVAGPNCTPASPCIGVTTQRAELKNYIADHAQVTILGTPQVWGTTVRIRTEGRADPFRAAGGDRLINNGTVEVRDGKVASYIDVPDMSDAQMAQFFAGVQQGSPSAPPADGRGRGGLLHPPPRRRLAGLRVRTDLHELDPRNMTDMHREPLGRTRCGTLLQYRAVSDTRIRESPCACPHMHLRTSQTGNS